MVAVSDTLEATSFRTYADGSCIICGAGAPGPEIGRVRDHEYTTTPAIDFPVVQCPKCQLVYLYPRPDVSELGRIYPPDYYSYHFMKSPTGVAGGKRSRIQQLFHRINLGKFRDRIKPYFLDKDRGRPLRILDVGCGTGHQLDIMRELFPGAETHGVEMGSIAAEQARGRGHTVYNARFEEAELPAHHFDIIISLHVIEHVARPDKFLEKCRDVLAKDGLILIETPNTDCLDFRFLQGHHWGGYHAPRHWYLFRRETFTVLAQRLNLRIQASSPYPVSVFWNWTCHSLAQSALGRGLADILFPPVTIFYGGLRSLFILGTFSVLEGLQMRLTGKANGLWIVFSPASDAA